MMQNTDVQLEEIPETDSSHHSQGTLCMSRNDQNWESRKEEIQKLYMTENHTLLKTMKILEERHGFKRRLVNPCFY